MKKFYAIILLSCLLVACSKAKQDPNDDPAFAPQVNPHPQYFMTVKGFIDPQLPKGLNLVWDATFSTNNSACDYMFNALEGVTSYRTRDVTFEVKPDKEGYYQIKIPLDYFQPGKCEWKIQTIEYTTDAIDGTPTLVNYFDDNVKYLKSLSLQKYSEIICATDIASCRFGKQEQYSTNLPRNYNYVYELNIRRSEKK